MLTGMIITLIISGMVMYVIGLIALPKNYNETHFKLYDYMLLGGCLCLISAIALYVVQNTA